MSNLFFLFSEFNSFHTIDSYATTKMFPLSQSKINWIWEIMKAYHTTINSRRNVSGTKNLQLFCNLTIKDLLPCLVYYRNWKLKGQKTKDNKTTVNVETYKHFEYRNIDILNIEFSEAVAYNANDLPLITMPDKEILLLINFLNFLFIVVMVQWLSKWKHTHNLRKLKENKTEEGTYHYHFSALPFADFLW